MGGETLSLLEEIGCHIPDGIKGHRYRLFSDKYYDNLVRKAWSNTAKVSMVLHILEKYRDLHEGERVFLLGSGPSLEHTPLDLLKSEYTIGVNSLYHIDVSFDYYMVGDGNVWNHHKYQILGVNCPLFLSEVSGTKYLVNANHYDRLRKRKGVLSPILPIRDGKGEFNEGSLFADPVVDKWYGRVSIMFSCLRLAFFMGYKEIFLLGVDCSHQDGVHVDGSKGFGRPQWNEDFNRYRMVRDSFKEKGVKISNCTVGGNLEVFPRISLKEVIG